MISLIRYPGSKAKLTRQIMRWFPDEVMMELLSTQRPIEYREPFFGAGAVGFDVLAKIDPDCAVWLNDKDPWMVALWKTVRDNPDSLVKRCNKFVPTAEWFYKFKDSDGDPSVADEQAAFRKLALHRMSYSGMGFKAGGPIGGKKQTNATYDVGCRWNPENIKKQVAVASKRLRKFTRIKFTCGDFGPLLCGAAPSTFIYLDPPYYEKGPELYKFSMTDDDHVRLAGMVRGLCCRWALSYDDHARVRELYAGCEFRDLHVTYTTATARTDKRPKNREVVILPVAFSATSAA